MKYSSTVKRWHIAIAAIFLLSSFNYCTFFIHGAQTKWENNFDEFQYLQQCMSGSFSSELQSKQDSDFFDIRLRMVPIWTPSSTEFFLYVEQARADMLDKPYRQRIYKVVKEDNTHFTSYIYMAPNQELLVGKESNDSVFSTFTADSLKIKDGCEVHLTFNAANQSEQIFFIICSSLWLFFFIRITKVFLWRLIGKEIIRMDREGLFVKNAFGSRGKSETFNYQTIFKLGLIKRDPASFLAFLDDSFWIIGGERIGFSYSGRKIQLGKQLDARDAELLLRVMESAIREYKKG